MSRSATTPAPAALPVPGAERWMLLRGGIQNVWEYDDRRFVFERGRLLLRGQNEAGKTKAMELLFPFLLDADLSPQRLDPFGSVARPMHWNLINEADPDLQARTGYVWLELGRVEEGAPRFATLGCGLRARRGTRDVDHWFFLTSRRVDAGLDLVVDRQPLARAALAGVLGGDGQVFDRGADYRRAVNELLLGMPDEQYGALIETLIQLRRPQLSKSLDLDHLSALLSASLPPLDRGVVGAIAEGFERLDHHRAELEQRLELLEKVRGFEEVHRAHARAVAKGRAVELTRAESAYHAARAEARERAAALASARERHAALEGRAAELDARAQALEERRRALEGSDAYRAALDLDQAEEAARIAAGHAREAARRMEEDGRLAAEGEARRAAASADEAERAERLAGARAAAVERARAAALEGAHAAVEALAVQGEAERAAGALAAVRREREEVIARLRALAGALAQAREAARRAEERARERAEALEAARDALRGAEATRAEAEAAWEGAVEAWAASLRELPRQELPAALPADGAVAPRVFRAGVEALAEPLRRALADARAAAVNRRTSALELAVGLRAERDGLAAAGYPALAPPPWRAPRPADRAGAPLFLLCDFGPGAAGLEPGLEAALEASGLLDAWVEPNGTVLDPLTGEAVLRAGEAVPGATLLDALVPLAAGGVSEERGRAVLASVGLAAPGEEPPGSVWVSADGRFRLGPLRGAHAKPAPAYVGATARERERARRIAELDGRIASAEAEAAAASEAAAAAAARADALAREVAAAPAGEAIEAARVREEARAEALAEARARHAEAEERAAAAERQAREAGAALDRAAGEAGLSAFSRDPEALAERSRAWAVSVEAMVAAARELVRAGASPARTSSRAAATMASTDTAHARDRSASASGSREKADRPASPAARSSAAPALSHLPLRGGRPLLGLRVARPRLRQRLRRASSRTRAPGITARRRGRDLPSERVGARRRRGRGLAGCGHLRLGGSDAPRARLARLALARRRPHAARASRARRAAARAGSGRRPKPRRFPGGSSPGAAAPRTRGPPGPAPRRRPLPRAGRARQGASRPAPASPARSTASPVSGSSTVPFGSTQASSRPDASESRLPSPRSSPAAPGPKWAEKEGTARRAGAVRRPAARARAAARARGSRPPPASRARPGVHRELERARPAVHRGRARRRGPGAAAPPGPPPPRGRPRRDRAPRLLGGRRELLAPELPEGRRRPRLRAAPSTPPRPRPASLPRPAGRRARPRAPRPRSRGPSSARRTASRACASAPASARSRAIASSRSRRTAASAPASPPSPCTASPRRRRCRRRRRARSTAAARARRGARPLGLVGRSRRPPRLALPPATAPCSSSGARPLARGPPRCGRPPPGPGRARRGCTVRALQRPPPLFERLRPRVQLRRPPLQRRVGLRTNAQGGRRCARLGAAPRDRRSPRG